MEDYIRVDRIENAIAVCECGDRRLLQIPLSQLPKGLKEGDCLHKGADGYHLDPEETHRRRAANRELFEQILRKPNKE